MDDLKGLHNCLLNLMIEINDICEKHNIKYTLMGGSLIGAIRHNGFIPWDDDMDIGMLYDDYMKFIDVLSNLHHPWITFDHAFSKDYEEQFMKVYDSRTTLKEAKSYRIKGVFVDVFPIIPIGNTLRSAKRRFYYDNVLKMSRYNKTNNSKSSKSKMLVYKLVGLFHSTNGLTKKIQKIRKKLSLKKDYKFYSDPDGAVVGIVDKDCFAEFIMHKFENTELMIIKNYDKYLTHIFGDYMKLPPKEKQVPGHFEILDLNKSYLKRGE